MKYPSELVRLSEMLRTCDAAHMSWTIPGSAWTVRAIREEFILDAVSLRHCPLSLAKVRIEKMRKTVRRYPSEFTSGAMGCIDRLYAESVARRLLGEIEG